MDKLIALPIKGESFLLFRNGKVILVDGGYNSRNLASALEKVSPGLTHIDIVVCTHSDRDHAGGLQQITRYFGGTIGEFWLPGIWSGIIQQFRGSPRHVFEGLKREFEGLIEHLGSAAIWSGSSIKDRLDTMAVEQRRNRDGGLQPSFDEHPQRKGESLDLYRIRNPFDYWSSYLVRDARSVVYKARATRKVSYDLANYWLSLIKSAAIIWTIAAQASENGIRIRLFDFERFRASRLALGGVPGLLTPLNSVESLPSISGLSYLAQLSPVNQECLAFISPPNKDGYGVIFCGDSPLGDGAQYKDSFLKSLPNPDVAYVVTAPHHGSESNRIAYQHIYEHLESVLWLRSGGSIRQPGATFKSLDVSVRACTHCPQRDKPLRPVVIPLSRSVQSVKTYDRECECR